MKILITEEQLNEIIRASDVYGVGEVEDVRTVADGRRDVAWVVMKSNTLEDQISIKKIVEENDLGVMYVKGNSLDAYVIYRKGSEKEAHELKEIAEKYGGYLSYEATHDETRRIGQLLGYHPDDIESHIQDRISRGLS